MNSRRWCLLFAIFSLLAGPAFGAGFVLVNEPGLPDRVVLPPEPFPRPWPRSRPMPPGCLLEMTSLYLQATIKDQFAVTEVTQEFKNPTNRRLEGTFLLPVPKGAQLRKFAMEIDGKPVEAELLDADKARDIYEDVVRRLRDPALLEFAGRDLYKVRIFPLEPFASKKVTLSYEQLLVSDSGLVRFEFPLSVGKYSANPVGKISLAIALRSELPLKTIYSPTHDMEITRRGEREATIGYETTGGAETGDFELYFSRENEGVGMSLLTYRADENKDGYFMLLASPGLVAKRGKVLPKDVVLVLDTSGSMAGGKLDQAKKALSFCVENLNDGDRFEIIRFATDVEPLFQSLVPADRAHRSRALGFIERLKPLGGTAINEALKTSLKLRLKSGDRPFDLIFLTDGLPTVGETSIDRIVTNVTSGPNDNTRIFCFGIGTDVNTHLLDRIAESTRAASQYVLPNEDLEVKLSAFFAKIKDPVLNRPELELPAEVHANRIYPSPLPDLFNGGQLVAVGRYSGAGKGPAKLRGQAADESRLLAEDVEFARSAGECDFIPRLWATRRIGWLLDEIRLHGESQELKDEIATLARDHGIVTPYTSWLIVQDEERRGVRPDFRTLRETSSNRDALNFSRQSFVNLGRSQTGLDAALSSRFGASAKGAMRATPAAIARDAAVTDERFLQRFESATGAAIPTRVPTAGGRLPSSVPPGNEVTPSELASHAEVVGAKTFYRNGNEWIDAEAQLHTNLPRKKLEFGSRAYFDLVKKDAAVANWLALGDQLQFVFEGKIYEIGPATK